MSILIDESYANPNQQLWATNGSVPAPLPAIFATDGFDSGNGYTIPANTQVALTFADTGGFITGASYNCIYCFYIADVTYRETTTTPFPLIFGLNFKNYSSGIEYITDTTQINNPNPSLLLWMSLPFIYDGSNTSIEFTVTNPNRSETYFVIVTTSEAIIQTSSSPTSVTQYFIPA